MDLQAILSDNQIAVLGCFAALIVCGGIAAMSFRFGPAGRNSADLDRTDYDAIRPLRRETETTDETTRRAA